jgi:SAM-dependent methyltransferase
MKVLDVGSGAGDVALLAAELVGPNGTVVGIDTNPAVLDVARERALDAGVANVQFVEGDAATIELPDDFDAVVGRVVLIYAADPSALLRAVVGHLKPGGLVAFEESDCQLWMDYALASPGAIVLRQVYAWAIRNFERSGANPRIGPELLRLYREANLVDIGLSLYAPMGEPPDWAGHDWVVEVARSILPQLEAYCIATAEEVGLETLAERLRADVEAGVPVMLPPHVGARARKP